MTSELFDPQTGLLQRRVDSRYAIYQEELDNLFSRCWLAICHQDQVPAPGDFLLSKMAVDPVLVWRGLDGELRVFLNFCPQSGSRFAFAETGNAEVLECRCHSQPYGSDGLAPGGAFELVRVSRIDSYFGLIFATHESPAASLDEYLGDFGFYLEPLLRDRQVRYGALKGTIAANWKLPMESFAGGLAIENAHRPLQPEPLDDLLQISAGPGSLSGYWDADDNFVPVRGALFPNLALSWAEEAMHLVMPRTARSTEIWSLLLSRAGDTPEEQRQQRQRFQNDFAIGSPVFNDLAIHWEEITRVSAGVMARTEPVRLTSGLGRERFHEDLPGIIGDGDSELSQRAFYRTWMQFLRA